VHRKETFPHKDQPPKKERDKASNTKQYEANDTNVTKRRNVCVCSNVSKLAYSAKLVVFVRQMPKFLLFQCLSVVGPEGNTYKLAFRHTTHEL